MEVTEDYNLKNVRVLGRNDTQDVACEFPITRRLFLSLVWFFLEEYRESMELKPLQAFRPCTFPSWKDRRLLDCTSTFSWQSEDL
jgi:hypothetical protein